MSFRLTSSGHQLPTLFRPVSRSLAPRSWLKAAARPRLADATHLRTFRSEYGKKARAGLLLHAGRTLEWIAPEVLAAPWWKVL